MFAFNENKIYGGYMKQKLDEKDRGLTPVRNGKAAGANPAEFTFSSKQSLPSKIAATEFGCGDRDEM